MENVTFVISVVGIWLGDGEGESICLKLLINLIGFFLFSSLAMSYRLVVFPYCIFSIGDTVGNVLIIGEEDVLELLDGCCRLEFVIVGIKEVLE